MLRAHFIEVTMKYIILSLLLAVVCTAALAAAVKAPDKTDSVHEKAGLSCTDCHGTDKPDSRAPQGPCRDCHGDKSDDKSIKFTGASGKSYETVVHNSHVGSVRCTLCHKSHEPSILYCNTESCHTHKLTVP